MTRSQNNSYYASASYKIITISVRLLKLTTTMCVYDFELCVVGAGLIGSAAARHASLILGDKVCLIGPSEPEMSIFYRRDRASLNYSISILLI